MYWPYHDIDSWTEDNFRVHGEGFKTPEDIFLKIFHLSAVKGPGRVVNISPVEVSAGIRGKEAVAFRGPVGKREGILGKLAAGWAVSCLKRIS